MAEPTQAAAAKPMGRVKKSPQELAEYFYNQKKMHIICFFSSLAMLVCFVWMVWKDYDRPWKEYQRAFLDADLALKQLEVRRQELELEKKKSEREAKQATIDDEEKKLQQDAEVQVSVRWLADAKNQGALTDRRMKFNFADSKQKAARSAYEIAQIDLEKAKSEKSPLVPELQEKVEKNFKAFLALDQELQRARAELDAIDSQNSAHEALVEARRKPIVKLEDELKKDDAEREKLQRYLDAERPRLATAIRNAPMLDFFGPQQKIKQRVLTDVMEDIHFETQIQKVDRCETCHVAIGDPAWAATRTIEKGEEVYHFNDPIRRKLVEPDWASDDPILQEATVKAFLEGDASVKALRAAWFADADDRQRFIKAFMSHPYPELYVTSNSPHPVERFGCSVCHEGDGRETEFSLAVHTPQNAGERAVWERRHHYHFRHLWDYPMLPAQHVYASCRRCHSTEIELRGGKDYNQGMILFERAGCYGCHRTEGYRVLEKDLPKLPGGGLDQSFRTRRPGPPLTRLSEKVNKDWVFNWTLEPRAFRPTTRMPHFFGQTNARSVALRSTDMDDRVLRTAGPAEVEEVVAGCITAYLFDAARPLTLPEPPPVAADVAKGKYIFESVGCVACHAVKGRQDYRDERDKKLEPPSYRMAEFAPSLGGIGSKVNPKWLHAWLKQPHAYFADTRMPKLLRTDEEAAHLTAYLMTLKEPEWEAQVARRPLPDLKAAPAQEVIKHLMREIISKRAPVVSANQQINAMSDEDRIRWLGDRMVQNFGCYGCHEMIDPKKDEKEQWTKLEGIGVELTGAQPFGSKFHDRLDFGDTKFDGVHHFGVPVTDPFREGEIVIDPFTHEPSPDAKARVSETRHDWLRAKLLNPRVFDAGKLGSKPPDELLRMPNFGFNAYEAGLLTTFVLSMTDHEFKGLMDRCRKRPNPREAALNRGRRLLRENNCAACHRMSTGRIKIAYVKDGKRTESWFDADVRELPESDVRDFNQKIDDEEISWNWPVPLPKRDGKADVRKLFQLEQVVDPVTLVKSDERLPERRVPAQVVLDLIPGEGGTIVPQLAQAKAAVYPGLTNTPLLVPPWLRTQGHKTRPEWIFEFLKRPTMIRPNLWLPVAQEGPFKGQEDIQVRMGNFELTDEEAASLARYFVALDKTDELESTPQANPDYLAPRRPKIEHMMGRVTNECAKCHMLAGRPPTDTEDQLKWAPDLLNAGRRLRPRWMGFWFSDPAPIYPGTIMTAYTFAPDFKPIENQEDLIQTMIDTMVNIERLHAEAAPVKPPAPPPEREPPR
jgi:cytochrome c551/c552